MPYYSLTQANTSPLLGLQAICTYAPFFQTSTSTSTSTLGSTVYVHDYEDTQTGGGQRRVLAVYSNSGIVVYTGLDTTVTTASIDIRPPMLWSTVTCSAVGVQNFVPHAKERLRQRRQEHRIRSSIKRSIRLLENFDLADEARIFIQGDGDFWVSHPSSMFKFKFSRDGHSLISNTQRGSHSTPYCLELWTKDDRRISKLCVFVEDTPILDQVLAVAVFIRSGDEDYILKQSNYFSTSRDEVLLDEISQYVPKLLK